MLIDWILPLIGTGCIVLCLFYFYKGVQNAEALQQNIKLEKLGVDLKLSSLSLVLIVATIVLIVPTIYFRYKQYDLLSRRVDDLTQRLALQENTIENSRSLIKEIQNCTLPIYVLLKNTDNNTGIPSLDDLSCEMIIDRRRLPEVTVVRGIDQYQFKILLEQANCNSVIDRIEIKDGNKKRVWAASNITPCDYVTKNLEMKQTQ